MRDFTGGRVIALVGGIGLIGLGIIVLAGQLFPGFNLGERLWPLFVIVPGLLFFAGMFAAGPRGAGLAVPGAIITMTGMILFYQAFTGHFSSWAYAWALVFPTALGLGLAMTGLWRDDPKTVRTGGKMVAIGLGLFVLFGAFFEVVLNLNGLRSQGLFGPAAALALIAAGVVVLVRSVRAPRV